MRALPATFGLALLLSAAPAIAQPTLVIERDARLWSSAAPFTGPFMDYDAFVAATPEWKAGQDRANEQANNAEFRQLLARMQEQQFVCGASSRSEAEVAAALNGAPADLRARLTAAIGDLRRRIELWLQGVRAGTNPVGSVSPDVQACREATETQAGLMQRVQALKDANLNALAPAFIADLTEFGRAEGLGDIRVFPATTIASFQPATRAGPRNVTARFLAWRAGRQR